MSTVIRSGLDQILLAVQAQLMFIMGLPEERVIIDTETDEQEQARVQNYQAEQVVFVRAGSSTPEVGVEGMGRLWAPQRVNLNITLWTRCGLDEVPGYGLGMTDISLGHEPWRSKIDDALLTWPPVDDDLNWIVQQPLMPGGGSPAARRTLADRTWARSVTTFICSYAPDVDIFGPPQAPTRPPRDNTPPAFGSALVPSAGRSVVVTLVEAGSPPVLPATGASGFAVTVGGSPVTLGGVTIAGTTATLPLSTRIIHIGESVTVSYTPGNVTDSRIRRGPNAMLAFGSQAVTNNSTVPIPDTIRPVFASASVPSAGDRVNVVLAETGSPPILPASGVTGFTVTVNASPRTISGATAMGNTVTLTLVQPVYIGDVVTVAYAPGNVTDSALSPNSMLAFTAQPATNNSTVPVPDTTRPTFASASVPTAGDRVSVVLTETGSPPILPASGVSGFTVLVNSASASISAATASGTTVTLLMTQTIHTGDVVTVSYVPGNVTDSAATPNSMLTFGTQTVTNNSTVAVPDTTPPAFASASVPTTGDRVSVVLTETGSPPVLPASGVTGFVVNINGVTATIASATVSSVTIILMLSATVFAGDIITVAYAPGNVTDSAANAMLSFSAQSVANNSNLTAGPFSSDESTVTPPGNARGWSNVRRPLIVPWSAFTTSGTTWYVKPAGSDGDTGTSVAHAFATLTHAVSVAVSGDIIYLLPGTYTGTITILNTVSNLTISCAKPADGGALGTAKIIASDANITSNPATPIISINGNSSGTMLNGLEIVGLKGRAGATTPEHFQSCGVQISQPGNGGTIQNCLIHDAIHSGIKGGLNWVVEGNYVYDCGTGGQDHGIYDGEAGTLMDGNYFVDCPGFGMHLYSGPDGQVSRRNIVVGCGTGGILTAGASTHPSYSNTFYNNVVWGNPGPGFTFYHQGNNNTLRSNIIASNSNPAYNYGEIGVDWGGGGDCTIICFGNDIDYCVAWPHVSDSRLLAGNNGCSGTNTVGSHMLNVDPQFVDPTNGDFRLQGGSPCLTGGVDMGIGLGTRMGAF